MRDINTPEDCEEVLREFLEWRLRYDEDVSAGKIKPIPADEQLVEAA